MSNEKVTLGEHEVDVYPQRHAYLSNKLQAFFKDLIVDGGADISDASALIGMLDDRAYDLLEVVMPQYCKRCPKYEFAGYGSQAAYEAQEYDEREDKSPSFPEIVNAFEVAARINRFNVLKIIGNVIDPKLLKTWINSQMAERLSSASASSLSSRAGSEASTSSGTTDPTSTENEGSPSPGSEDSPRPVSAAA